MRLSLSGNDWQVTDLYPSEWAWLPLAQPGTDLDNLSLAIPPWRPATVPGDVQSDLLSSGEFAEPWRDMESRAWEWTSERDWVYRKQFELPEEVRGHTAALVFEGVDYACHVFLNGVKVGEHAGTYVPFELDVAAAVRPGETNQLVVVVEHAPSEPDQQAQIGWTGKVRLWKPRFAYKWDWCTRLVPLGIHDDVRLETWKVARIRKVKAATQLRMERVGVCSAATVAVQAETDGADGTPLTLDVRLRAPDGRTIYRGARQLTPELGRSMTPPVEIIVDNPELWWPNGCGEQPLYGLVVELLTTDGQPVDSWNGRIGFREVRAVPNEGAPADALPYTLEVNGLRVFAKGWNWAPVSQLYGRTNEARYRHAIRLAKDAHCNLLRVWGGGLLEREVFYDLCDEAGIIVWQEFPQSSSGIQNEPARDPEYVAYCVGQAEQMVRRRAHHPSLAIWCGGNELMDDSQTPNGLDHPVLGALAEVVASEDPKRLYLPTSPSGLAFAADPKNRGRMHDVHGHWLYMGDPDHYTFYNEIDPLLHSEFGCEGTANLRALERFLSDRYLWPPDRTNPAWVHHGAWWLHRDKVEAMFGPIDDLRRYVFVSQWIQYEGLRYAAEASRRRKWRTSGCAPWQFNESWPNTSCTNCLGFFGDVRPAYWAMRGAYAPTAVSLRYDRLRWEPGGVYEAQAWLNASLPSPIPSAEIVETRAVRSVAWSLTRLDRLAPIASGTFEAPLVTAPAALKIGDIAAGLPTDEGIYGLCLEGAPFEPQAPTPAAPSQTADGLSKRYLFTTHSEPIFAPLIAMPASRMLIEQTGSDRFTVACPADAAAPLLYLRADAVGEMHGLSDQAHAGTNLTWGYAPYLLPGERVEVRCDGSGPVEVTALNAEPSILRVG